MINPSIDIDVVQLNNSRYENHFTVEVVSSPVILKE